MFMFKFRIFIISFNLYLFFRFFFSIFVIVVLKPQTPEWNPLIYLLKKEFESSYPTYEIAKKKLAIITWSLIFFYFIGH